MFILGVQNTESKKFKKEKKTGNKREVKKIKIFEDEELEEEEEKIEEENNKENEEEDEDPKLEFSCARLRPFTKQKVKRIYLILICKNLLVRELFFLF